MTSPLVRKLGLRPGMRTIWIQAPDDVRAAMPAAELDVKTKLTGSFAFIHAFLTTEKEFVRTFPRLKRYLEPTGALWISWPKNGQLGSDLTLPKVIKLGYDEDLVESKCISVNSVWSALKFTFPKPGKTYHNSFGTLKTPRP